MTTAVPAARLERMRWWHVEAALPIEDDLFGAERWTAGMFWSELAQPDRRYLVALSPADDAMVGYGGLAGADEACWVQNIAVRRDWQRHGIGKRLLEALIDEARRRAVNRVALEVADDNPVAQRMYAMRGFEPIARRRGYYQPSGTDAIVMALPLDAEPAGDSAADVAADSVGGATGEGRA